MEEALAVEQANDRDGLSATPAVDRDCLLLPPSPRNGNRLPASKTFRKGQSGNPHGRPKGASVEAPFLRIMAEDANEHGEGRLAEQYARQLHAAVNAGDIEQIKSILAIMERTDPIAKKIEHSVAAPPVLVVEGSSADSAAILEGFGPSKEAERSEADDSSDE